MEAILVNHGGKHLIRPQGPLTSNDAQELVDIIDSRLAEWGYCFTLDLRNVPRLDDFSAGAIRRQDSRPAERDDVHGGHSDARRAA